MIEEQIKKANIEAMKNKDTVARSFFSVLLNKIMLEKIARRESGKEISDADISNIIQKTIKELNDEKENYKKVGNLGQVEIIDREISIASQYLPKMMSKEEIVTILNSLEDKSLPFVMKYFKQNFNGQVEMRLVQEVLKDLS